jgi:hypothetical protein
MGAPALEIQLPSAPVQAGLSAALAVSSIAAASSRLAAPRARTRAGRTIAHRTCEPLLRARARDCGPWLGQQVGQPFGYAGATLRCPDVIPPRHIDSQPGTWQVG